MPRPPLVAALETMVHLDFRPTPATALVAKLQFPLGYPQVRAGCGSSNSRWAIHRCWQAAKHGGAGVLGLDAWANWWVGGWVAIVVVTLIVFPRPHDALRAARKGFAVSGTRRVMQ